MPNNKRFSLRAKVLDGLLRKEGGVSMREILRIVNRVLAMYGISPVSKETISRDILALENGYHKVIVTSRDKRDKRIIRYRYEDSSFSIFNTPLTDREIKEIKGLFDVLSSINGFPQCDWMNELCARFDVATEINGRKVVQFEESCSKLGMEWFSKIFHTILDQKAAVITYQRFGYEKRRHTVFLREIKYVPSRLKANLVDEDGNRYQGVDEYVGVVLRGTPGHTYHYEIGEHDYTQGAEGQWLMDDAMAYSGASFEANLMAGDANDEFYVHKTVIDEGGNEIVNYGLNNNRFKVYNKDGWLMYNKSYLQLPRSVSDAIERNKDAESEDFADLTFVFENADGTTDKVSAVEFTRNAESDIFYNPHGQRVKGDAKGIVIHDGRKVVNK